MTNHQGQRCRASEAKTKKYPQSQKEKQGVHGLIDDHSKSKTELSGMDLCRYDVGGTVRSGRTSRSITFRADSGACATVVPKEHKPRMTATLDERTTLQARTHCEMKVAHSFKPKCQVHQLECQRDCRHELLVCRKLWCHWWTWSTKVKSWWLTHPPVLHATRQ